MAPHVLVFELNEVPYQVIDRFVADHPSSAFARLMPRAARLHTHLPDRGQLHPKISWQTFHRGVPVDVHGYREYNQIEAPGREANPTLWELLQRNGKRVGCGASIGSWPLPGDRHGIAFWLSDPFAPTPESIPSRIEAFQRFNTAAVQRSSRTVRAGGLDRQAALDFLKAAPRLGIRPSTCLAVVRQLVAERRNRARAVRRRSLQALMSFDVSLAHWQRTRPDFSTLFANHVASAMHRYWAATFPDDYAVNNMPQDWRDTYRDEIDAAMQVADHMLDRLFKAAARVPGTRIVALGSMGQSGIPHEVTHNQLVIRDMTRFMDALGMSADRYERHPGMEPEYVLAFADAAGLQAFDQARHRLSIDGGAPSCKRNNDTQCAVLVDRYNVDFDTVLLDGLPVPLASVGLGIETIDDLAGSTAQHVAEGSCLVFEPGKDLSGYSQPDQLHDLCSVSSSILRALDVEVPDYMPAPPPGLVRVLAGEAEDATRPIGDVDGDDEGTSRERPHHSGRTSAGVRASGRPLQPHAPQGEGRTQGEARRPAKHLPASNAR